MRIFLGVPDHTHTYNETFIESVPQEVPPAWHSIVQLIAGGSVGHYSILSAFLCCQR